MRIYIAGPISTLPLETAQRNFLEAKANIQLSGHTAVNPMGLRHEHDKSWESYMKACIAEMVTCDVILLLPQWQQSKGARIERNLAKSLKIPVWKKI